MDRERFEHLLAAYGADFRRWPADARGSAACFMSQHGAELADAVSAQRALDTALEQVRAVQDTTALEQRVLAAAPRPSQGRAFDRRAALALAACAVFGIVLGYGGGLLAPLADEDSSYFAVAFEVPFGGEG